MKFIELLRQWNADPLDSVELYHWDIDGEYPTLVEPHLAQFTPFALEKYATLLDAEVMRNSINNGNCYVHLTSDAVNDDFLEAMIQDFCEAHSGNIANDKYELLWKEGA